MPTTRGRLSSPSGVLVSSALLTVVLAVVAHGMLEVWQVSGDRGPGSRVEVPELPLFLLSTLVVWLFVVGLVALFGRLWPAVGVVVAVVTLLGYANHRKQQLLMEPLYPSDLVYLTQLDFLAQMVGGWSLAGLAVAALALVAGSVWLGRRVSRRFPRPDRRRHPRLAWGLLATRVVALVAVVATFGHLANFHAEGNAFRAVYDEYGAHWRPWNQSRNYSDNGFVAGMLYNLPMTAMTRPEGYDARAMREIVEKYTDLAIRTNRQRDPRALTDVNVVYVLGEAFSDPLRSRTVDLAEDPIPYTRSLMRRTTSGRLLSEKFGGGTANVEFEVLTGLSQALMKPQLTTPFQMLVPEHERFPSVVRYYESRGLTSLALHSFTPALYRRPEVYPALGFDRAVFDDAMTHRDSVGNSEFISDRATFEEVLDRLEATEEPTFAHVVTMQNHYPQADRYDDPIESTGMTDPEARANLEHYARGLRHSDEALEWFVEQLDASEEKTVLLFYGDHLPPLWAGGGVGMGPRKKHETPFLVYANFGALEKNIRPTTGGIHLTNHVLDITNAPVTPFQALLRRLERHIPAMTRGTVIDPDNERITSDDLSPEAREVLRDYRLVEYDLAVGAGYAEDALLAVPPDDDTVTAFRE